MRGSLLQCSYVSLGSETSQTVLAAGREEYDRAKGQVCAICGLMQRSKKAPSFDHLIGAGEERGRLALAVFRLMTSLLWSASAPVNQPAFSTLRMRSTIAYRPP
jgi:hypothetical protein